MDLRSVAGWRVPAALLLLGSLPILTGAASLIGMMQGLGGEAAPGAEPNHYLVQPVPIVAHILAGSLVSILGPLQLLPGLRVRRPGVHRAVGRAFVAAGLVAAATALWMSATFPLIAGGVTLAANLAFGVALPASLLLAVQAIRAGRVAWHRAWTLRAYAIGLGVATQRLLLVPWFLVAGIPGDPWLGLSLWGCWLLNLAVAEVAIRRGRAAPSRPGRHAPA